MPLAGVQDSWGDVYAGEKITEEYKTEYSTDKIEMHVGSILPSQRVVLVSKKLSAGITDRRVWQS